VGENMKQLELSAEKAVEREEKLKDKILNIQQKYKAAEGRYSTFTRETLKRPYRENFIADFFVRNLRQYGTYSTVGNYK
jgi:hypothetical protein